MNEYLLQHLHVGGDDVRIKINENINNSKIFIKLRNK
jgi:hypothetical protein